MSKSETLTLVPLWIYSKCKLTRHECLPRKLYSLYHQNKAECKVQAGHGTSKSQQNQLNSTSLVGSAESLLGMHLVNLFQGMLFKLLRPAYSTPFLCKPPPLSCALFAVINVISVLYSTSVSALAVPCRHTEGLGGHPLPGPRVTGL